MSTTWQIMLSSLYRDNGDNHMSVKSLTPSWNGSNVASCSLNLPLSLPPPPISFIQPSATSRWLSSRPVGVERPICGLILLRRRAVNTHFCGCQFGEDEQPCGTQRSISSIPSSGNRAGFKAARASLFLFSLPSQGTMLLLLNLPHIDLEVMLCVIRYFFLLFESTSIYVLLMSRHILLCCFLIAVVVQKWIETCSI